HGLPKEWRYLLPALWHARVPGLYAILGLPALLWVSHMARAWAMVGWVVGWGLLFWFWVSQVDRYLLTVLPAGALLCMGVVQKTFQWAASCAPAPALAHGREALRALALGVAVILAGISAKALWERPSIAAQRAVHDEIVLLRQAEALADRYGARVLN